MNPPIPAIPEAVSLIYQQALAPIESIISKCEKARLKFEDGSSHYIRFSKMIEAMDIAKAYIRDAINNRELG